MSLIVEFRIRSPDLVLGPTLADGPDVTLSLVTEAATDPDQPYLQFWARGSDYDAFQAAMEDDPTVAAVHRYTELDDQTLYSIQISEATEVVTYGMWVETGVVPLESRWEKGWWHVQMRFPDRSALSDIRTYCEEQGIDFSLERVYEDEGRERAGLDLTDKQRQVLLTAYELGYFDIPREATMADVADALGISNQAVSERLRRGYRQMVSEYAH